MSLKYLVIIVRKRLHRYDSQRTTVQEFAVSFHSGSLGSNLVLKSLHGKYLYSLKPPCEPPSLVEHAFQNKDVTLVEAKARKSLSSRQAELPSRFI